MTDHEVTSRQEWLAAREALFEREKEHIRLGDELARERRELQWVRVEKDYRPGVQAAHGLELSVGIRWG